LVFGIRLLRREHRDLVLFGLRLRGGFQTCRLKIGSKRDNLVAQLRRFRRRRFRTTFPIVDRVALVFDHTTKLHDHEQGLALARVDHVDVLGTLHKILRPKRDHHVIRDPASRRAVELARRPIHLVLRRVEQHLILGKLVRRGLKLNSELTHLGV
jgi:hypothetical protein